MKYRYLKFSTLLLLLYFQVGFSQNGNLSKPYLPCESIRVNCMVEDSENNVWIGTENALIVWDSVHDNPDCISEVSEGIRQIVVDEMDNKWLIGIQGTVFKMNSNNTISNHWFINKYLTTYQKTTSAYLRDESLWIGTSDGFIIELNTSEGKKDTISTPVDGTIHSIYVDTEKQICIGTDEGMFLQKNPKGNWLSGNQLVGDLQLDGGSSISLLQLQIDYLYDIEEVFAITSIQDDLWILGKSQNSTTFSLIGWTNNSWESYFIDCLTTTPKHIKVDEQGNIWLNNEYEVVRYNPSDGNCKSIINRQRNPIVNISNIVVDSGRQRLWIGSAKKGLYYKELNNIIKLPPEIPNNPPKSPEEPVPVPFAENNLVFLLDGSSSMNTRKKRSILKTGMFRLIRNLGKKDTVSIVAYSGKATEILSSTSGEEKRKIRNSIEDLPKLSGNTNVYNGLNYAYEVAKNSLLKNGNNKIILITDGEDIQEKHIDDIIYMIKSHEQKNIPISLSILYFDETEDYYIANKFRRLSKLKSVIYKYLRGERLGKVLLEEITEPVKSANND